MKNQTALQKANEKWFDEDKWFNEPDNQEDLRKNYCLLLLTDLRYGEIFKLFNTNFQKFYENALKLDFGTPNDEGWAPNVICPFHDERNPSFAVNLKTGTFRCFGCNQRGTAIQFYQRKHQVGYRKAIEDLGDLSGFDWDPRKLQQKLEANEPEQIYYYLDQNNNTRFQICRFKNKQFRCRTIDSSGNYVWNLKGVELSPYRLPEVIKAVTVYIVEGEKDADNLAAIGLTASCNPFGAGKWKPIYNQYFRGKQVLILSDNDEQGRSHALQVANSLNGKAASIKIIELPGLPEKGDVSDWLKDGDSKEKLLEICGKTPFWSPDSKQLMPAPEQVLSTISISELLSKKFEKTEGIIDKGILPEGGGLLIVGESEVGKSLITLEWAIHLSIGRSILDGLLPVPKARRLCIFQCEIPLRLVKTRLNRILSGLGIKKPNDSIFLAKPEYQYNLSNSKCIENMIRVLIEREAEVFIVDPLSSFHTENENDNTRMRFVLDRITNICRRTGAATIVVHHFGKPVDGRNESYRVRGASSIKDWCDTLITITPKAHEHKTLRTLTFEKLRHGKKIRPILLERDNETFVHAVTEEDMIVTPKQIQEMLVNKFNGRAEKQSDLVEAVIKNYNCTDKTVRKAIDEAVNRKLILKQKRGRQAILTVLENSG